MPLWFGKTYIDAPLLEIGSKGNQDPTHTHTSVCACTHTEVFETEISLWDIYPKPLFSDNSEY